MGGGGKSEANVDDPSQCQTGVNETASRNFFSSNKAVFLSGIQSFVQRNKDTRFIFVLLHSPHFELENKASQSTTIR